jgi:pseudouridine-5'-phosphate glycosidase
MTLRVADEVRDALQSGRPVVALESSLIAQGLPVPHNLETALAAETAVRESGAIPATTGLDGGELVVGAPLELLQRLADPDRPVAKAASRDLGPLLAAGGLGSTTVSGAMRIAHMAGISLLATGGVGGVHRGAGGSWDVSSDIDELAATPVAVICSGPKSILDVPATFELLETRRVPVVGVGTELLPGFYAVSAGLPLAHMVESPAAAADAIARHLALAGAGGILLVRPPPADVALDGVTVEGWITDALASADARELRGAAVTPFVLAHVAEASGGRALLANIGLIVSNARMAGAIAVALANARSP